VKTTLAALSAGLCLAATAAHAATVTLDFDGLNGDARVNERVLDFYAGGQGSDGSAGGADFGITFSPEAIAICASPACNSNVAGAPSGPNVLGVLPDTTMVMDIAGGFDQALQFSWISTQTAHVTLWSGLGGTGTQLNGITLFGQPSGSNTDGCSGHTFCPFLPASLQALGVVHSIKFEGFTHGVVDDLTLFGATVPDAVPEPAAWALMISGFGLAGAALRRRRAAVAA
jgi:hypothetical protein